MWLREESVSFDYFEVDDEFQYGNGLDETMMHIEKYQLFDSHFSPDGTGITDEHYDELGSGYGFNIMIFLEEPPYFNVDIDHDMWWDPADLYTMPSLIRDMIALKFGD